MKKILALVVGGNQLLFALQAKHTIHKNDEMDIVYRDIYIDEEAALSVFDGVYRCKTSDRPPKRDGFRCFCCPQYAIKKYYADIDIEQYSDILFWHVDYLLYFIYKFSCYSGREFAWSLLPEGAGLYCISKRIFDSSINYGYKVISKFINFIDNRVFKFPSQVAKKVRNAYYINPRFAIDSCEYDKIEIPPIEVSDNSFLNQVNAVFKYNHECIHDKVIFLDGGLQGSRETALDSDKVDELLLLISNELGKDNVILKRKHGVDQSQYPESVKNSVTIYEDENMPWELICLNGDLNNCILISVPSSAIILPYIMGGVMEETYMLERKLIGWKLDTSLDDHSNNMYEMIMYETDCYNIIGSMEQLKNVLQKVSQKISIKRMNS